LAKVLKPDYSTAMKMPGVCFLSFIWSRLSLIIVNQPAMSGGIIEARADPVS
jgi:hypothetical protein